MKSVFGGRWLLIIVLLNCTTKPKYDAKRPAPVIEECKEQGPVTLVIHGGAGTIKRENMKPGMEQAYLNAMMGALNAGYEVLQNGGSSLDAVTTTVQLMEQSPLFNAGKGAVFTNDGKNELDASIMDGNTGMAGAVAGVTTIKSPILAARAVMERSDHVMLSGKGAEEFAASQGLEIVDPSYFYDENRFRQLERIKEQEKETTIPDMTADSKFGTVGCVALDQYGNVAAGTSTGGMTNKKYGRIGDSPIIGAGTYANNTCAISATGHGEFFIRNVVAYDVAALMEYKNLTLTEAAEMVVLDKLVKKGGSGGIIAIDKYGNISMPFNTSGMYRGYIQQKDNPIVFIYKE